MRHEGRNGEDIGVVPVYYWRDEMRDEEGGENEVNRVDACHRCLICSM
jgi:hypothetical protein